MNKRVIAIGDDGFESLRRHNSFYIDKTGFIRDWWNSRDKVTLIARPRRFGKTLNMSMMECFFSLKYQGRADLFEGLEIWNDAALRKEQGAWPVIFLSFANIKHAKWSDSRKVMNMKLSQEANRHHQMMEDPMFTDQDREAFQAIRTDMDDATASASLYNLCNWLERYYGRKVLIFLDEYDTPMQEAWLQGYWGEMVTYIRNLFNSTFKTNPSLERAILTGITRVSKESIFSDMNNLEVVTTTSDRYETAFGFTEEEVFAAMAEQDCPKEDEAEVKRWYDGFNFGRVTDIYNPWSVTNYLKKKKFQTWWANTSSNGLIGNLIRQGNPVIKQQFEALLRGETLTLPIDEEIVFNQLDENPESIWSLMLASGYLKVIPAKAGTMRESSFWLTLSVTNKETLDTLEKMVCNWFTKGGSMPPFLRSMLSGNVDDMEGYLNRIMADTISYFDSGNQPSDREPENFYHGLVLGLIAEKSADFYVRSNQESGFGRYDVVMEPKNIAVHPAVILEFKIFNSKNKEKTLEDTAANALSQIEKMKYDTALLARGIPAENILKYGIAFQGKECIVRKASNTCPSPTSV